MELAKATTRLERSTLLLLARFAVLASAAASVSLPLLGRERERLRTVQAEDPTLWVRGMERVAGGRKKDKEALQEISSPQKGRQLVIHSVLKVELTHEAWGAHWLPGSCLPALSSLNTRLQPVGD